jgi:hypothetical protein
MSSGTLGAVRTTVEALTIRRSSGNTLREELGGDGVEDFLTAQHWSILFCKAP